MDEICFIYEIEHMGMSTFRSSYIILEIYFTVWKKVQKNMLHIYALNEIEYMGMSIPAEFPSLLYHSLPTNIESAPAQL